MNKHSTWTKQGLDQVVVSGKTVDSIRVASLRAEAIQTRGV